MIALRISLFSLCLGGLCSQTLNAMPIASALAVMLGKVYAQRINATGDHAYRAFIKNGYTQFGKQVLVEHAAYERKKGEMATPWDGIPHKEHVALQIKFFDRMVKLHGRYVSLQVFHKDSDDRNVNVWWQEQEQLESATEKLFQTHKDLLEQELRKHYPEATVDQFIELLDKKKPE